MGGGGGLVDEDERSRIHAINYIFQTDVAQLVINRNCNTKTFAAQNLGGTCVPCESP